MAEAGRVPLIYVLAGTNGSGKSSVGGAMFRESHSNYFNPDEAAQRLIAANPGLTLSEASSKAWATMKRLLEKAIDERLDFAFETTLGGRTIFELLRTAIAAHIEVRIWYVGLGSPELNIARVSARVAAGGHPIPERKIRERYVSSIHNLTRILPEVTELQVFDNSVEMDPKTGKRPEPLRILHMDHGRLIDTCDLAEAPKWTKPILAVAMKKSTR